MKPFSDYAWESREATQPEIKGVTALFQNDKKEYERARAAFSSENVRVVKAPGKKTTIFILQLAVAAEDNNPINAVVIAEEGRFRKAAHVVGTSYGVTDIDGDGIPELLVSQADFGSSEFLLSLKTGHDLIWDIQSAQ